MVEPRAPEEPLKPRKPWIAAMLSLLLPGLGQLYAGEPWRGLAVYLGSLAVSIVPLWIGLPKTFPGLLGFILALVSYFLWMLWDSTRVARRNQGYILKPFNRWYWYLAALIIISFAAPKLIVAKLVSFSQVRSFKIPSTSMEPAVRIGDHLIADMTFYRSTKPSRGDLVVSTSPDDPKVQFIKRVVGLPGERIEICDQRIFINGRRLEDSWGHYYGKSWAALKGSSGPDIPNLENMAAVVIPDDQVFLIGDNRDHSYDSRHYGPVPLSFLQGRALYVYWSPDRSRIGMSLR